MSQRKVLEIFNNHAASCGEPIAFTNHGNHHYTGYFENEHGEQMIFIYDRKAKSGTVVSGDAGWENTYNVVDGVAQGLVVTSSEALWLKACWDAAAPRKKQ